MQMIILNDIKYYKESLNGLVLMGVLQMGPWGA